MVEYVRGLMKESLIYLLLICCRCTALISQPVPTNGPTAVQSKSCSLIHAQPANIDSISDAILASAFNSQARSIRSLHIVAMVKGHSEQSMNPLGNLVRDIPATIDMLKPGFVHIVGGFPFVKAGGFEMVSDGREFRVLKFQEGKRKLLIGSADKADRYLPSSEQNFRPNTLRDALMWKEGKPSVYSRSQSAQNADLRTLEMDVTSEHGEIHTLHIEFDLRVGVVNSVSISDPNRRSSFSINYGDWREVASSTARSSTACFPHRIHISQPEEKLDLDIRITQMVVNPNLSNLSFRLSPPRNVVVIHLDQAGSALAR
jgi:hypothetical protein